MRGKLSTLGKKESDSRSEEFEVESILDKRIIHGKIQYRVKWKNYQESEATWEPEENLTNCKTLIDKFQNSRLDTDTPKNLPSETTVVGVVLEGRSRLIYKAINKNTHQSFEITPENRELYINVILDYLHKHIRFGIEQ